MESDQAVETTTAKRHIVQTLFRPIYELVFVIVRSYLLHAPKRAGGYEGIDRIDVCSQITGISSTHLVRTPELCDERIDAYVHGFAVIVTTALTVFLVVHISSFMRFFAQLYWQSRREVRLKELQMVIDEEKRRKNKLRSIKSEDTKSKNRVAHSTLSSIRIILDTIGIKAEDKLTMIERAMRGDHSEDNDDQESDSTTSRLVVLDK